MTKYVVLATDLIDPVAESKHKDFRYGPCEWCICTGANALRDAEHRAARWRQVFKTVTVRTVGEVVES